MLGLGKRLRSLIYWRVWHDLVVIDRWKRILNKEKK